MTNYFSQKTGVIILTNGYVHENFAIRKYRKSEILYLVEL